MQNGNNYGIMQKIIKLPKGAAGFWKRKLRTGKNRGEIRRI